jgi:alpha-tubulin suppressor-like RCC1 family protein
MPNLAMPGFRLIQAGVGFACGVVDELAPFAENPSTGTVYCWGDNTFGQLGAGLDPIVYPSHSYPVPVIDERGAKLTKVSSLALGDKHACVVTEVKTLCWGANESGQLGLGTQNASSWARPLQVVTAKDSYDHPTSIASAYDAFSGSLRLLQVAAGRAHTCALTTAGHVLCWGSAQQDQIGDQNDYSETPDALTKIVQTDAATASRLFPVYVRNEDLTLSLAESLAVYGNSTCLLKSGNLDCRGELIAPTGSWVQAALGAEGGCGLTAEGLVSCWGNSVPLATPKTKDLQPLGAAVGLVLGGRTACALLKTKSWFCWGNSDHNQLQIPETSSVNAVPVFTGSYRSCSQFLVAP